MRLEWVHPLDDGLPSPDAPLSDREAERLGIDDEGRRDMAEWGLGSLSDATPQNLFPDWLPRPNSEGDAFSLRLWLLMCQRYVASLDPLHKTDFPTVLRAMSESISNFSDDPDIPGSIIYIETLLHSLRLGVFHPTSDIFLLGGLSPLLKHIGYAPEIMTDMAFHIAESYSQHKPLSRGSNLQAPAFKHWREQWADIPFSRKAKAVLPIFRELPSHSGFLEPHTTIDLDSLELDNIDPKLLKLLDALEDGCNHLDEQELGLLLSGFDAVQHILKNSDTDDYELVPYLEHFSQLKKILRGYLHSTNRHCLAFKLQLDKTFAIDLDEATKHVYYWDDPIAPYTMEEPYASISERIMQASMATREAISQSNWQEAKANFERLEAETLSAQKENPDAHWSHFFSAASDMIDFALWQGDSAPWHDNRQGDFVKSLYERSLTSLNTYPTQVRKFSELIAKCLRELPKYYGKHGLSGHGDKLLDAFYELLEQDCQQDSPSLPEVLHEGYAAGVIVGLKGIVEWGDYINGYEEDWPRLTRVLDNPHFPHHGYKPYVLEALSILLGRWNRPVYTKLPELYEQFKALALELGDLTRFEQTAGKLYVNMVMYKTSCWRLDTIDDPLALPDCIAFYHDAPTQPDENDDGPFQNSNFGDVRLWLLEQENIAFGRKPCFDEAHIQVFRGLYMRVTHPRNAHVGIGVDLWFSLLRQLGDRIQSDRVKTALTPVIQDMIKNAVKHDSIIAKRLYNSFSDLITDHGYSESLLISILRMVEWLKDKNHLHETDVEDFSKKYVDKWVTTFPDCRELYAFRDGIAKRDFFRFREPGSIHIDTTASLAAGYALAYQKNLLGLDLWLEAVEVREWLEKVIEDYPDAYQMDLKNGESLMAMIIQRCGEKKYQEPFWPLANKYAELRSKFVKTILQRINQVNSSKLAGLWDLWHETVDQFGLKDISSTIQFDLKDGQFIDAMKTLMYGYVEGCHRTSDQSEQAMVKLSEQLLAIAYQTSTWSDYRDLFLVYIKAYLNKANEPWVLRMLGILEKIALKQWDKGEHRFGMQLLFKDLLPDLLRPERSDYTRRYALHLQANTLRQMHWHEEFCEELKSIKPCDGFSL